MSTDQSTPPSRADLERALEFARSAGRLEAMAGYTLTAEEHLALTFTPGEREWIDARRLAGLTEPQTEEPHEADSSVSSPAETRTGQAEGVAALVADDVSGCRTGERERNRGTPPTPLSPLAGSASTAPASRVAAPVVPVTAETLNDHSYKATMLASFSSGGTRNALLKFGAAFGGHILSTSFKRAADLIDTLQRQQQEAETRLARYQEREAACCPEDFGFEEVITSLRKQLTEAQTTIATLTQERDEARDVCLEWESLGKKNVVAARATLLDQVLAIVDDYELPPSAMRGRIAALRAQPPSEEAT